jgi:N-acetylneuraminic acid mutarotase
MSTHAAHIRRRIESVSLRPDGNAAARMLRRAAGSCVVAGLLLWMMASSAFAAVEPHDIDERVRCQIAIEDIGWSHRLWPEHNTIAKPARSAVLSNADIRAKVETSLRMESALSARYGIHVSTRMLQVELNRIARSTRAPTRLRELFVALGNDPHAVAECIARPLLVSRTLRDAYSRDGSVHGRLHASAEALLSAGASAERLQASGASVTTATYVVATDENLLDEAGSSNDRIELAGSQTSLEPAEFDALRARLSAVERVTTPAGAADREPRLPRHAALRETESAFVFERTLDATDARIEVEVVVWPKESFDTWWSTEAKAVTAAAPRTAVEELLLPAIGGHGGSTPMAAADTWRLEQFPVRRAMNSAVWTGAEMIIWGGYTAGLLLGPTDSGGRYDPTTDTWTPTPTTDAPLARAVHTAVWTGSEMIVWGGEQTTGTLNTGSRYDPVQDRWRPISSINAPAARRSHVAVWTGAEMLVWGGASARLTAQFPGYLVAGAGARFDPVSNTWAPLPTTGAPSGRADHTAVWTGAEMIIWGGRNLGGEQRTGGRYAPSTNTWVATPEVSTMARTSHTAVWTGDRMIIWGGSWGLGDGGVAYDPVANTWSTISTANEPSTRGLHSAVWTGSRMIVWGGHSNHETLGNGGSYDPASDTWTAIASANAPSPRASPSAVWTGDEMIIWGGGLKSGGRYDPAADTWLATADNRGPDARGHHTAVWTGSEMIVWAGSSDSNGAYAVNSGGRYDPMLDSWTPTALIGAPTARQLPSGVWTGLEMLVWGGMAQGVHFGDGGRYDPDSDSWSSMSSTGAPVARVSPTAVWSGSELVVWGGSSGAGVLGSGGRFDPTTDTWTAVPDVGSPSPRRAHVAVWSGSDMLVWGGHDGTSAVRTGGRFSPTTNAWTPMSMTGAPEARERHAAVWSGTELITSGGISASSLHLRTGGRYNPSSDSWRSLDWDAQTRVGHTALWTGREMLVWGANGRTGAIYDPITDRMRPTTQVGAPTSRSRFTAVWTGDSMIIWGGCCAVDTIGVYYPYATTATLNYTAGSNGTIAGSATQIVAIGDDGEPVSAVPAATYRFAQWSDGRTDNPRQDLDVMADIAVQASFALLEYTVSASAVGEGSIAPADQTVAHGGAASFVVAPAANHHVVAVAGDTCTPVDDRQGTWIAENITSACAVVATFAIDTFSVTMEVDANGSVVPAPGQPFPLSAVPYGSQVEFDVTPDAGHRIHGAGGCGGSLEGGRYTTAPIESSCTVWARFNRNPVAIDAERILREDQNVYGFMRADDDDPLVFTLVTTGTLGTATIDDPASGVYTYVPSPNANGSDHFTFQVSDGVAQSNVATVFVTIRAVNDRPQFEPDAIAPHAAGESGERTVVNFGTVVVGPPDEQATQTIEGFIIDSIDDVDGVLQPGSVSIDPVQMLRYTLTGTGGTAQVTVRVRDTGGTANGGVDISLPRTFVIAVAASADLQVAKSIVGGAPSGNDVIYAITVTNAGPNAAEGATLADPVPPGLIDAEWACNPGVSTAPCPNPSAGTGDMQASVALPVGTFLRFDFTARIDAPLDTTITNTASVTAPAAVADLLPDSNIASATFVHGSDRIFGDGFETGGEVLTVPDAAAAHRAASR